MNEYTNKSNIESYELEVLDLYDYDTEINEVEEDLYIYYF